MRELTADMFVTLDGFASDADGGQNWISGYAGPEFGAFIRSVLDEPQLMIMGRVTYQVLSRYWPAATDEAAHRMNSLPKLVFSNTLREPLPWNNTRLAQGDLASEIAALKRQPGIRSARSAASSSCGTWSSWAKSTGCGSWSSRPSSESQASSRSSTVTTRPASRSPAQPCLTRTLSCWSTGPLRRHR